LDDNLYLSQSPQRSQRPDAIQRLDLQVKIEGSLNNSVRTLVVGNKQAYALPQGISTPPDAFAPERLDLSSSTGLIEGGAGES
jgi:hypothetical protein